jgi:rhamnogalacturonan endolyase
MKALRSACRFWLLAFALTALVWTATSLAAAPPAAAAGAPVTIVDDGRSWTMDNGIVKVTVSKDGGSLMSLVYHGFNTGSRGIWEHTPQGAPEVTNTITIDPATNGGERAEVSIKGVGGGKFVFTAGAPGGGTLNDIELRYSLGRGDSGIYTYSIFSHPASYPAAGSGAEDRFIDALDRRFDWITVDKDRNMLEAAPTDWGEGVVVHAKEQRIMAKGVYKNSVEHKYSYSGSMYHNPAIGWSSTQDHIGVWFINPTAEYLSGGPDRIDLDAHFGDNGNPPPIILDYWHSGHYDGAHANVAAGEEWNKVIGPIFVYVNSLDNPKPTSQAELDTLKATEGNPTVPASWAANANALWQDALAQAKKENAKWPYGWVKGVDYTPADQRGNVKGQFVLDDPLAPKGESKKLPHLTVGLTHADLDPATIPRPAPLPPVPGAAGAGAGRGGPASGAPPIVPGGPGGAAAGLGAAAGPGAAAAGPGRGGFGGFNFAPAADAGSWIHDARFYQFFNDGSDDGKFAITKVRPGSYTLHAWADGVLGEYAQANITVEPGKTIDLGKIVWKPVRYGKQLWEIGTPDRAADEFLKGDGQNYWLWGWNLRYALLFPNDLTYTVGKSDPKKDWFFEEVPHATNLSFVNPEAKDPANQRFGWVKAESLIQYPQTDQTGPWRVYGRGKETVWTIKFNVDKPEHGVAALRVALAGVDGLRNGLPVTVNGQSVGAVGDASNPDNPHLIQTNAIRYNTDKGLWQERTLKFDASVLKAGENIMTFTVPAGDLQSGVVWDYLRLELDENAKLTSATTQQAGL